MGIVIPNAGMESAAGVADALFPTVRQRVLGLLFGAPERDFSNNDLIRLAGCGTGAVHREVTQLAAAGLVTVTPVGNQKRYRANPNSPVFAELRGLVVKTGLVDPLRSALSPWRDRIAAAFVYGSVGDGTASGLDLMVVGDDLPDVEIDRAVRAAENALCRRIGIKVVTRAEWRRKLAKKKGFVTKVVNQPKLFVMGAEALLDRLDDMPPPQLGPMKPAE